MLDLKRTVVKVSGESGQGVNSIGEILAKALKESGFYSFGYREYPSLIKGGYSSHQIDFSDQPLFASSTHTDLLLCLSRVSVHAYLPTVRENGQIIHMLRALEFTDAEQQLIRERNIKVAYIPAEVVATEAGGKAIMSNVVMVGALWQLLGLPIEPLEQVVRAEFAKKPDMIEPNLKCLQQGHTYNLEGLTPLKLSWKVVPELERDALLTGNHLLALGSVAAGVRAYFAYPMTPSSSILSYMATIYKDTGILVKQVEDEISVAQMAIGAMFMGTRALVGTSGGGFDLMTESVSMAAMTETPFVCILAQRPGPATGLPTWTAAADLHLAVFAAHGEFARLVISASDAASTYLVVQKAFNLAEKYQIPVIVLTEKQIAESLFQMTELPPDLPIERHLPSEAELENLVSADRYKYTESGVSPRWFPGQSDAMYDANTDEHLPDGTLTEEGEPTRLMYEKRIKKQNGLLSELPEPEILGPADAWMTFVGWGSVRNTMHDVMELWNQAHSDKPINYLHYEYVWPLRTDTLNQFIKDKANLILIENNALGQLGTLITQSTSFQFKDRILKYDGRGFFVEDVLGYLETKAK